MLNREENLDKYKIKKTLGFGFSGSVILAENITTKQLCALKIMDSQNSNNFIINCFRNENEILKNLNHKNIIKNFGLKKGIFKMEKISKEIYFLVLKFYPRGDFFNLSKKIGKFNENMTRFFAEQLLSGLEYLNFNGIAHRDLKIDNLLLDKDFNLVIADFGFSSEIDKIDFEYENENTKRVGTCNYMSPEILSFQSYNAEKNDIFAFGVIVFIFYFGHLPFKQADGKYYSRFKNKPNKFWRDHFKLAKMDYSEDIVLFLSKMLAFNPEERFYVSEIRNCNWFKKEIDIEKAKNDLTNYLGDVNIEKVFNEFEDFGDGCVIEEKYNI